MAEAMVSSRWAMTSRARGAGALAHPGGQGVDLDAVVAELADGQEGGRADCRAHHEELHVALDRVREQLAPDDGDADGHDDEGE